MISDAYRYLIIDIDNRRSKFIHLLDVDNHRQILDNSASYLIDSLCRHFANGNDRLFDLPSIELFDRRCNVVTTRIAHGFHVLIGEFDFIRRSNDDKMTRMRYIRTEFVLKMIIVDV